MECIRSKRKTIQVRIFNNKVYIRAPYKTSSNFIRSIFEKYKNKLKPENIITLFGKDYNIKTIETKVLIKPQFEILKNEFIIYKPQCIGSIDKYLIDWKKRKIKKIIEAIIKNLISKYNFNFSFDKNKIHYKNQITLWGSCSNKNNLNFNCNLISKKIEIIYYIIIHELCHTIHKNHSKKFYKEIEKIIPNYIKIIKELKNF